jgi:hypothetical protein
MIHNPYPAPTSEEDKQACRFQTYLSGEDKGLLSSIRPIRGTPQAVVNHLIKNLCNDLRELGITSYRPDADDIFAILVEPRDLTEGQLARLRCTTIGTTQQVSKRIREYRGGTEVRKGLANPSPSSNDAAGKVTRRKPQDRKGPARKKKTAN